MTQIFFIKKYYYYLFLLLIMRILSRATIAHGIRHITCMEKKNCVKKHLYIVSTMIIHAQ